MVLADPAIRAFREMWLGQLSSDDAHPIQMAAGAMKFVESASKDAPARRDRLRLLIDMTIDLYQHALRTRAGITDPDAHADWNVATCLAESWPQDIDSLASCITRCVTALRHIDAMANLQNVVESLLSDLDRLRTRGSDFLLAGSSS
jgi:hypothetical protein